MGIREKIETRLDELEVCMKENQHLDADRVQRVDELISSISKFVSVLSDSQRDYVISARFALAEQLPWGL